jgi:hypothetical protein
MYPLRVMASWPTQRNRPGLGSDWWVTTYGPVSWVGLEVLITFGSVVGLAQGVAMVLHLRVQGEDSKPWGCYEASLPGPVWGESSDG